MKNRALRHKLLTHPRFIEMPDAAQLLYLALLCHVDDHGICKADETEIAIACRPGHAVADVRECLSLLCNAGYLVPRDEFILVAGFRIDQKAARPAPEHFDEAELPVGYRIIVESEPDLKMQNPTDRPVKQDRDSPVFDDLAVDAGFREPPNAAEDIEPTASATSQDDAPSSTGTGINRTAHAPIPDDVWRQRVKTLRDHGRWLAYYGPKPGKAGCMVPKHIEMEFAS